MYRVCGLQLGPNFVSRLTAENYFYLRLTVEKMYALAICNNKYLRSSSYSDTNSTAAVNCTNPKTEILSEIIEIQIIGTQINFLFNR